MYYRFILTSTEQNKIENLEYEYVKGDDITEILKRFRTTLDLIIQNYLEDDEFNLLNNLISGEISFKMEAITEEVYIDWCNNK